MNDNTIIYPAAFLLISLLVFAACPPPRVYRPSENHLRLGLFVMVISGTIAVTLFIVGMTDWGILFACLAEGILLLCAWSSAPAPKKRPKPTKIDWHAFDHAREKWSRTEL